MQPIYILIPHLLAAARHMQDTRRGYCGKQHWSDGGLVLARRFLFFPSLRHHLPRGLLGTSLMSRWVLSIKLVLSTTVSFYDFI